jgi:diamine N-acetyltransferase
MSVHLLPTHSLQIRVATTGDAAAITEIATRVFVRAFAPDNTPENLAAYVPTAFSEAVQRRELDDPMCVYLLAYVDGALAAFALLRVGATDAAVHGDAPVEIQRFYVDHDFHGQGLAAHLMEACVATAQERGGRTLWLGTWEKNARAIRFYEKCGFTDVGTHPFVMGSEVQTDRVMVRGIAHGIAHGRPAMDR